MLENREAKNWNNFVLGLLIALMPFFGLPASWKTGFFVVAGLLVALFSLARVPRSPGV